MTHDHTHDHTHYHIHTNERSTRIVVIISFVTMLLELYVGYHVNSKTLVMDGWHMLSHVLVLSLAWLAYFYIGRKKNIAPEQEQRIIAQSGFTSAVVMLLITVFMIYENFEKFYSHELDVTLEAMLVAVIGLMVNGVSAFFLHREEEKRDVNMHAAYLHVLSDIVISVLALAALLAAKYFNWKILDPLFALAAALVILKWSIGLIQKSWREVIGRSSN